MRSKCLKRVNGGLIINVFREFFLFVFKTRWVLKCVCIVCVTFLFFILGFAEDPGNTLPSCVLWPKAYLKIISLFFINTSIRGTGKGTKIRVCV